MYNIQQHLKHTRQAKTARILDLFYFYCLGIFNASYPNPNWGVAGLNGQPISISICWPSDPGLTSVRSIQSAGILDLGIRSHLGCRTSTWIAEKKTTIVRLYWDFSK